VSKRSKRRQGGHAAERPEAGSRGADDRSSRGGREAGSRGADDRSGRGAREAGSRGADERSGRGAREAGAREVRGAGGRRTPEPGGRAAAARQASGHAAPRGAGGHAPHARDAASGWSLGVQIAFLVAVFAVTVLVAELAGAANLGVALGVGQIAFATGGRLESVTPAVRPSRRSTTRVRLGLISLT
jgi:hypothetical protein